MGLLPPRTFPHVGLSLRGCVRDIVDGNHRLANVDRIICRTTLPTREAVIAYVTQGRVSQKERMAEVAGRLWDEGRIVQPLLSGQDVDVGAHPTLLWFPLAA